MKLFTLLFLFIAFTTGLQATTVTAFTGTYRNGQVFFTWNNITNLNTTYKLYRSSSQIKHGSQLSSCEYLGYTDQNSALNGNLTAHDGTNVYWIIKTNGAALVSAQGLFVSTSIANGSYYYALTTTISSEDTAIIAGTNSLTAPIVETVAKPLPVLQQTRTIDNVPVDIYGDFMSSRVLLNGPLRFKAGWLGYDFAVYRNNATTPQAVHLRFHAGGADFLTNITHVTSTEVNLGVEDLFPDQENSGWLGSNELYDPYKKSVNNTPPVTGLNYFFTLNRILDELNWTIANCHGDSNRVSVDGVSFGSYGAFFFTLLHPDKIASADLTSGIFNFGFQTDYVSTCTMNTGQKNRKDGDKLFGTVETNLYEAGGLHTYDKLNGGKMIHDYNTLSYPVIFSQNGRRDTMLGWTEKTIWYDSVNNNHLGGFYFFDQRDHAGDNKTWNSDSQFDMYKYRRNVSWPAFSNCSINNIHGNGNPDDGDPVGCINGYLDWSGDITDDANNWIIKIFMKDEKQINGGLSIAPATCSADITPRRLQVFNPSAGTTLTWSLKHLNQQVQTGTIFYQGGLLTIPGVNLFKDTCLFQITYGTSNCTATINPTGNISACQSTSVVFTANSGSGFTYQWYKNEVPISGATKSTYKSKGSESGSYKVKVTNNVGCLAYSPSSTLSRIDKPASKINPQGDLNICTTGSVVLKAKTGTGTMWQWSKNNINISGATQQNYTATSSGDYTVTTTSPEGCTKKSSKVTVTNSCRDINNNSTIGSGLTVNVSPNPAADYTMVTLNCPLNGGGIAQLALVNLLGEPVRFFNLPMNGENSQGTIDLKGIPSGLYFLKTTLLEAAVIQSLVIR